MSRWGRVEKKAIVLGKTARVLISGTAGIVWFLAVAIVLYSYLASVQEPAPPYPAGDPSDQIYFPRTAHRAEGPFADYYRTHGGLRIFGYAQTERFFDEQLGLWVQYFDNVRMEWHPENDEPYRVQLAPLGEILGHGTAPIPRDLALIGNPLRRHFPETGHVVSYAFLLFYDQYGGADIFGDPISEPQLENESIVQYFQRARMEWHPQRAPGERVALGALGVAYIQRFGVPDAYYKPVDPGTISPDADLIAEEEPSLRVLAFVHDAVTRPGGSQTVYVRVTDAFRQPVTEARVTISVPDDWQITLPLAETDSRGLANVKFPIPADPPQAPLPGQRIIVDVTVEWGEQSQTAQTSFAPWY